MFNHFRTLLMNSAYAKLIVYNPALEVTLAPIHTPTTFAIHNYSETLKSIIEILMPASYSAYYKHAAAHHYLTVVAAAGLNEDLAKFDPRITYDLEGSNFFKHTHTSSPTYSHPGTAMTITGKLNALESINQYYEEFVVTQQTTTQNVIVTTLVSPASYPISLTFSGGNTGASPIYSIGTTGLSFSISSSTNFTSVGGKIWKFRAEVPLSLDTSSIVDKLDKRKEEITRMLDLSPKFNTEKHENMWNYHTNKVHRLAGLLIAFVARLDKEYSG